MCYRLFKTNETERVARGVVPRWRGLGGGVQPTRSRSHGGLSRELGRTIGAAMYVKNIKVFFAYTMLFLICGMLLSVFPHQVFADSFIVSDGKPNAEIVISEKPARMTRLAAEELRDYIRKMSGAEMQITSQPSNNYPIKIYVGESTYTEQKNIKVKDLKYDAFVIRSGNGWLALLGRDKDYMPPQIWAKNYWSIPPMMQEWDDLTGEKWGNSYCALYRDYSNSMGLWEHDGRGTINAVYQFLRDLGCRWYFPGELGEIVPTTSNIILLHSNMEVKPDFNCRKMYIIYNEFFDNHVDNLKWQLRLNISSDSECFGAGYEPHGLNKVHERNEVKQAHPEYYAIWGGKRQNVDGAGKPCLSSEGLFEQTVSYLRTMFNTYDDCMIHIGPADGYAYLCECNLCKGKSTPERGYNGQLSDYVWGFVNRVAMELYKTHPDRKILCSAYTTYMLPPLNINTLSPNISINISRWRTWLLEPGKYEFYSNLREEWLQKLPSKALYMRDYYLHARPDGPWQGIPVYFPHLIDADLKAHKGKSQGEWIEVGTNHTTWGLTWDALAANHLNVYVTSRLYWDATQNIDALLEEYYRLFYGPAAVEMKAFVEYAEANWMNAPNNFEIINQFVDLLDTARKAAGDGIYGKRIDLLVEFMEPLRQRRDQLAKGRKDVPKARAYNRAKKDVKLDGKLDDVFWQNMNAYSLSEVEKGLKPINPTSFKMGWDGESLCFGITCQDQDTGKLHITATKDGDAAIWSGDYVELLLETQSHSYYQITISPVGAVVYRDRKNGINERWSAGAEVASYIGEGYWGIEIRIPVAGDGQELLDPYNGVSGRKPTESYPWYFNVCRQRVRDNKKEGSAFSPTGEKEFHNILKFGELYCK